MARVTLKTTDELQVMREAGRLLASVFSYLDKYVTVGISTMDINNLVERYIVDQLGAHPASKGQYGYQYVLNTSVNHVVCHGIPDDIVLKDGEVMQDYKNHNIQNAAKELAKLPKQDH